ncbi:helix-turn-helix domain-containing protein [Pricia antarctica]|nr:LuxR C-terminal-related transcriptional regulator [Pricia antarctica]
MHTDIKVLAPMDYHTFRSGLATDKSGTDCIDPLPYFVPLIQSFEKLALGRYFWFILDFPKGKHCASGGDVDSLTPFTNERFSSLEQLQLHGVTHPEDLNKILAFSRFWIELYDGRRAMGDLKVTLFFRMLNALGDYYWIMVQYPEVIMNENYKIVYGLVLVTDISHIKSQGEPMMTILNQKEHICQQFYCLNANTLSQTEFTPPRLTRREKEILQLLTKGHGSKQIASLLHISTKTVDNHRQNMLHKTGSKSSSEMVSMGIRLGMV